MAPPAQLILLPIELLTVILAHVQELVIHYHYVEDVPKEEEYYPILVEDLVPAISCLFKLSRLVVKGLEYDVVRGCDDPIFGQTPRPNSLSTISAWLFEQSTKAMSCVLPSLSTCELCMSDLISVEHRRDHDALKFQAHSLQELELDFYLLFERPALDFREFKVLEQLTFNPVALRGSEGSADENFNLHCHLQPNIRRLRFRQYNESILAYLNTLPMVYD
ncbi:hypothetical protein BBP40_008942 [Aspergillus hancockii]|nr:hypothetical protein BBP40_008942 [Aspergillus hancockii]